MDGVPAVPVFANARDVLAVLLVHGDAPQAPQIVGGGGGRRRYLQWRRRVRRTLAHRWGKQLSGVQTIKGAGSSL